VWCTYPTTAIFKHLKKENNLFSREAATRGQSLEMHFTFVEDVTYVVMLLSK